MESVDPLIGQTIRETYFVEQKIGDGGMGQVYQAVDRKSDQAVALKILKKTLLDDPVARERFNREAHAALLLRHPNIVSAIDFGETEDGTVFLAMEYVAGRTLARIIAEESPLLERRTVHLGAQILAGLAEAHANQILHRDLKPANVMVESRTDEPEAARILDFGIAKNLLVVEGQATLTQTGIIFGTPAYMSPEQWSGNELDGRSDLYSVGVILYEMLTGFVPFQVHTPLEMVRKHLTERPVPPSQRRTGRAVSLELEALVMRALAVAPDERPQSAQQMREELLACALWPEPAASPRLIPGASGTAPYVPALPPGASIRREPEVEVAPPARQGKFTLLVTAAAVALLVAGVVFAAGLVGRPSPSAATEPPSPISPLPVVTAISPATDPPTTPPFPGPATPGSSLQETTGAHGGTAAEETRRPARQPLDVSNHINAFHLPYPESGQGLLAITADPSGRVLLDGKLYGEAPKEFRLPAGTYRLQVTHPLLGERQTVIRVRAGKRTQWVAVY